MNISQQWKKIEEQANVNLKDWEILKDFIWKLQLKIQELTKSRDKWKEKYNKIK